MTLVWGPSGWEGDFRFKGFQRLRVSLRSDKKREAKDRHDAIHRLFRERRDDMIAQIRAGDLSPERVEAIIRHDEPRVPIVREIVRAQWPTVDDASKAYVTWYENHPKKAEATARNADFELRPFREFVYEGVRIGTLNVTDVTSKMVEAYQGSLLAAEKPLNTITNYMSRVSALYRWLVKQEAKAAKDEKRAPHLLHSPVDAEMIVRDRTARERMLTEDEAALLLAATPAPLRFPVMCALYAGLRLNEVLHLRPGHDVDVAEGVLIVQKRKGWTPKTKRSQRVVPMAPPLLIAAMEHIARYATTSWMMPGVKTPNAALNDLTFRKHFIKIVERAGLEYGRDAATGVTFHTLRHTFASHAVMRGVDLYTVAQLLGDALKTVEQTYAHLSRDFKRAAIAKVAAAFETAPKDAPKTTVITEATE